MPRKKLVYETCRFPSKERHKGVKQEELADLSFEPCGKILVTGGRGTINRSRKRTPPLNLSASLPHRASDRVRRGTLAKTCARTAAAGMDIVATRKKGLFHSALVILGKALFRCF